MGMDIRNIELGRISPNLRTVCTVECIDEIARSIKFHGQLEAILISFEHDSFRIIDGEKRWRACKRLGMRKIKAFITKTA
jgi:ParB family chromosome partitioning protein